ncbi:MAG: BREX-2 system adenine-specific DNA-methyltransferase PglX [Polyangiaceae bacterium]|nr:BREX-2 system adenine-specific DNA-methyltransferase PglX [Polyangiaceae bacterium]
MAKAKKSPKRASSDLEGQSDPTAELDAGKFLAAARPVLKQLGEDLLARAKASRAVTLALEARHEAEKAARRTADAFTVWQSNLVDQVAAAWLLSCVFVRTLEDRGLIAQPRLAGPGASDSQRLFFDLAPSLAERDYLLTVFRELSHFPAARDLFDARHNPVWLLTPSAEAAKALLGLFRLPNADAPAFRFGQPDTRFLGDLYQDLNAAVKERYALLQTPRFVESFILDRTLEPAIERFGLDEATLIDPTCGSGHFLLGAFDRLFDHRLRKEPGLDVREAARRALDAVYGSDINPYAVAIARFRLTLAYLEKAGFSRLADAPALPLHLVVADSLLHNVQLEQRSLAELEGQSAKTWGGQEFALEDEAAARDVLHRRYAAVVGNPPYITVKDAVLRERYREMYSTAYRTYSLGVPFTERFFQLARSEGAVGMITANSFMKREFGAKLIEGYLPTVHLQLVVNTSGAYIPGHGTPTVLLFGASQPPSGADVLVVLAKRGEPTTPNDAERGFVWTSIAEHWSDLGFENEFISVARIERQRLSKHPWSLGGGGATELKDLLEERATGTLGQIVAAIGRTTVAGEDDVWMAPSGTWARRGVGDVAIPLVIGECVRDWTLAECPEILYPYEVLGGEVVSHDHPLLKVLWPWRSTLEARTVFGKQMKASGRRWWEHLEHYADKLRTPISIAFAFVATHNHFVLDHGGKVFKQSAPIIKLPETATEDDHFALLAYLNSSTACFWMKQVFQPKGSATRDTITPESNRYEFAGTGLSELPLPAGWRELRDWGLRLDECARMCSNEAPGKVLDRQTWRDGASLADELHRAETSRRSLLRQMAFLQEELDWAVYRLFGLTQLGVVNGLHEIDPERDRPFCWADRPPSLGLAVQTAYQERRAALQAEPMLGLIETTEMKRLWRGASNETGRYGASYAEETRFAAHAWLANAVEMDLQGSQETLGARDLSIRTLRDNRVLGVLRLLGTDDSDLTSALRSTFSANAVPFLAAYTYTPSGFAKHREWAELWDLQRREDRGDQVELSVPPSFSQGSRGKPTDFELDTYWELRGKLDVPKERFISYPGCESDQDGEPVYGWAGWNHLQRAQALAALYQKRRTEEAWGKDRLTPMLAGLLELLPWIKQWHNEPSDEYGGMRLGDFFEGFIDGECRTLGLTHDDLRAWRAADKRAARKAKSAAATSDESAASENGAEGAEAAPKSKPKKPRAPRKVKQKLESEPEA